MPSNNARNKSLDHTWYAGTGTNTRMMHRMILGVSDRATEVDHINKNGLDNRKENLRKVTKAQQRMNTGRSRAGVSKYRGVGFYLDKRATSPGKHGGGRWVAKLSLRGKTLSRYADSEKEAARLYNEMALEHFGTYARLNDLS